MRLDEMRNILSDFRPTKRLSEPLGRFPQGNKAKLSIYWFDFVPTLNNAHMGYDIYITRHCEYKQLK